MIIGRIEQLVQFLTVEGFKSRAEKLARYSGETDPGPQRRNRPRDCDGPMPVGIRSGGRPFEEFKSWVERELFGIVITAHPTFEISADLMRALSALAIGRDEGRVLDQDGPRQNTGPGGRQAARPGAAA